MNPFIRWCKFNAIGALGMGVQLVSLTLIDRWAAGRYLAATAVAIEITLLHNFAWHLACTWRDRRRSSAVWRQLVRFHLSNGLVSMIGNLMLMRILAGAAHMPAVAANSIAILCCSIVNFFFGDNWVFAAQRAEGSTITAPGTPCPRSHSARGRWGAA